MDRAVTGDTEAGISQAETELEAVAELLDQLANDLTNTDVGTGIRLAASLIRARFMGAVDGDAAAAANAAFSDGGRSARAIQPAVAVRLEPARGRRELASARCRRAGTTTSAAGPAR